MRYIFQPKYTKKILKKFEMDLFNSMKTHFNFTLKLGKDEGGEPFDERFYRGMIGSLLYLTASRPDILFNDYVCERF